MPTEQPFIVTIDGPSGSGKSTISRLLAQRLAYAYLDTGAMYRAVGLQLERTGISPTDIPALEHALANLSIELRPGQGEDICVLLNGEDVSQAIRTAEMGLIASRVSALPQVRAFLTRLQQDLGRRGGVVAEGRDMGTVVFPDAPYKFFLDASPEERARRRTDQLRAKGQAADYDNILAQIKKRDADDRSRALAPLRAADDARHIDSTTLTIEQVVTVMLETIQQGESV